MTNIDSSMHYSGGAKLLHWLVAGAIVLQYVLAKLAERAADADATVRVIGLLANHKSVGMTILVLACVRVIWRLSHRPPALPDSMPRWQIKASHASHLALYVLIFAVPLTGWLMSSASAYSVSWFGLFQFPDLVGADADLKHRLESIHEILAKSLFVIALIHIAAAFKHALFDKDGILRRISSAPTISAFLVVLAAGLFGLTTAGTSDTTKPATAAPVTAPQVDVESNVAPSVLRAWVVDSAASRITFAGDQAGAVFTGVWERFEARLQFDEELLGQSRFDVMIDTSSANTGDEERDVTMSDASWFDSDNVKTSRYQASAFESTDTGFVARGQLLIKNRSVATPLTFRITREGDKVTLDGEATLDRLAFNLGTGEWADTTWVGQNVDVRVHIEATDPSRP